MQGSSIAEVHSADASMVMVFYQDRDGMVYGRCVGLYHIQLSL